MAELIRAGEKDFPECGVVPGSNQNRAYRVALFSFQEDFSQADNGVIGGRNITYRN